MKGKNMFLGGLLLFSGLAVALIGVVIRFTMLEPLGISRQDSVMALPFVLLRDDGLRYVITDLRQGGASEGTTPPAEPTEPVESPEAEQTEVTVPRRDPLEKVLFIGDSRTCSLRDHARLEGADYFCEVGMSVFNVAGKQVSDQNFHSSTLAALLAEWEYTCVIINLGLNEAGYPLDSLLNAYRELLTRVVQTQPQATIVLQGIMTVSERWVKQVPYTAPENTAKINRAIQSMAEEYHVYYLDANERFADANGYLPDQLSADGCHLYAKYTSIWADWIYRAVEGLDR